MALEWSTSKVLSKVKVLARLVKRATATQLPNTSCIQCTDAGSGTMTSRCPTMRWSMLSRGRNIIRWSPKPTGCL